MGGVIILTQFRDKVVPITLALNQEQVFAEFKSLFDLKEKSILEIGGAIPYRCIEKSSVSRWVSVDPKNNILSRNDRYFRMAGMASSIRASDNDFDFAFSCNAFEHIIDLEKSLTEIYRVLKNGGYLYSHFGPIWSACDGHHLEGIQHDGKTYNFWDSYFIPFWYHLLFNKEQLEKMLSTVLNQKTAEKITDFIYSGNEINRLFYEDYLKIFLQSNFSIELIMGIDDLDYTPLFPKYSQVGEMKIHEILRRIQEKNGYDKRNILCRDMKVILRKNEN